MLYETGETQRTASKDFSSKRAALPILGRTVRTTSAEVVRRERGRFERHSSGATWDLPDVVSF